MGPGCTAMSLCIVLPLVHGVHISWHPALQCLCAPSCHWCTALTSSPGPRIISRPSHHLPAPPQLLRRYAAQWNPQQADVFLSASGDCTVKVGRRCSGCKERRNVCVYQAGHTKYAQRAPPSNPTRAPQPNEPRFLLPANAGLGCAAAARHPITSSAPVRGAGGRLVQVQRLHHRHGVGGQVHQGGCCLFIIAACPGRSWVPWSQVSALVKGLVCAHRLASAHSCNQERGKETARLGRG